MPPVDGTVVRRLREAGAVLLGKLQMTEGAFSAHHPDIVAPLNPWNAQTWTGVSSSGSGVAVAAGLCHGAIGTDTGGSIRFPSVANGVTGLKPTWGRVSRHGAFELAASMDHLGPICRSAADCGLMLGAIAGADPDDPTALQAPVPDYLAGDVQRLDGLRIGIDEAYVSRDVAPEVADALQAALRALVALGATPVAVTMPAGRCGGLGLGGPLRRRGRGGALGHLPRATQRIRARAGGTARRRARTERVPTTSASCSPAPSSRAACTR